jgi:hypothetical protein
MTLKDTIAQPKKMSTATQQLSKHIPVATNSQMIEELLEVLSYM